MLSFTSCFDNQCVTNSLARSSRIRIANAFCCQHNIETGHIFGQLQRFFNRRLRQQNPDINLCVIKFLHDFFQYGNRFGPCDIGMRQHALLHGISHHAGYSHLDSIFDKDPRSHRSPQIGNSIKLKIGTHEMNRIVCFSRMLTQQEFRL